MIVKTSEKKKAIELRRNGFSYNEIKKKVNVSKSTLSLWLREIGLAKRHARRLTERQKLAQQKAVKVIHERCVAKILRIKQKAASEIKYLTKREKWFIGISLYWAEGDKEKDRSTLVKFSNSDPRMILFFREWILDFLKINPSDMVYSLYIHEKSENIANAIRFWTNLLDIDCCELKLVLKKHNPSPKRKNIGVDYKGLVKITIRKSVDMNRKISGWINGIINKTEIIGE